MKRDTSAVPADVSSTVETKPGLFKAPITDYLDALDTCADSARDLAVIALWAVLGWWIYVPIHELLHAYGCLWSGGEVSRLEISPWYGAELLRLWFPFVASGSDYAGQLTGFDTKGSDLIYLATVLLPFSLSILVGVPLLRWGAAQTVRSRARLGLGLAIPVAYAPFVSLTGDYYETGSIIATRLTDWWSPGLPLERWRSDDLFLLVEQLFFSDQSLGTVDLVMVTASAMIALLATFLTYRAGRSVALLLVRSRATREK